MTSTLIRGRIAQESSRAFGKSAYQAEILSDNPVGYWPLSDEIGVVGDRNPKDYISSNHLDPLSVSSSVVLGFNGPTSKDRSLWASRPPSNTSNISALRSLNTYPSLGVTTSLECWFMITSGSSDGWVLLNLGGATASSFLVGITPSRKLYFRGRQNFSPYSDVIGDSVWDALGTTTVTLNQWHHAVGTHSTTNGAQIYLDGSFEDASSSFMTVDGLSSVYFNVHGNVNVTGEELGRNGEVNISQAALYSVELSPTQVGDHFSAMTVEDDVLLSLPSIVEEYDWALPETEVTVVSGGLSTESDSGRVGSVNQQISSSRATESDSAQVGSLDLEPILISGRAIETDSVVSGDNVVRFKALELDVALPGLIVVPSFVSGGLVTETDSARPSHIQNSAVSFESAVSIRRDSLELSPLDLASSCIPFGFWVAFEGLARPDFDYDRKYVPDSAWVSGKKLLVVGESLSTLNINFAISGIDHTDLDSKMTEIETALSQRTYYIDLNIDNQVTTYRADSVLPNWGVVNYLHQDTKMVKGSVAIPIRRSV